MARPSKSSPLQLEPLREKLRQAARERVSKDPLRHPQQVAQIAAILYDAFKRGGLESTLVGGSAIEVHAPGVYISGDIDLIIEKMRRDAAPIEDVFKLLGFRRYGRHWIIGDWFIEVPGTHLSDPAELMRVGSETFRVITKEAVLAERIIGFRHWQTTAYGQQALDMLAAFGDELDLPWLKKRLKDEASYDAYLELSKLAISEEPVTETTLGKLLDQLRRSRREPAR
ncbi:MAG: hypothetical protein HY705_04780 [Gemmatimonadetes bacterium]|nr:hypothetical protein [Gemmatimonadota bacterium]